MPSLRLLDPPLGSGRRRELALAIADREEGRREDLVMFSLLAEDLG
jgi:hypothetical protein